MKRIKNQKRKKEEKIKLKNVCNLQRNHDPMDRTLHFYQRFEKKAFYCIEKMKVLPQKWRHIFNLIK
jgi:hypothetical protein